MVNLKIVPTSSGDELVAPSLVEMTTRKLRDEILSGALPPGARLIEEQICLRFAISRAPLREAMRLLAQQGLVEHLPRRGVRVTVLTDIDIAELFEVRDLIEQHAARTMLPLGLGPGRDPLVKVKARLREMKQAQDQDDQLAKDDAHRAFHAEVVALAGNRQLDLALEPVLVKLQRPMATNLRREASLMGAGEGIARHQRMVDALETNDVDQVLTALRDHGGQRYLGRSETTMPGPASDSLPSPPPDRWPDELWDVIAPLLPTSAGRRGRPWHDHRRTLEGIAWRYRTGAGWREMPTEYGQWRTVWERHDRWSKDGTYARMRDAAHTAGLVADLDGDPFEALLSVKPTPWGPGANLASN